ncbi:MAG TPA: adenosylcobinamide-GDP ribazoletransferase, partial [Acidimicrobiales bacterium]|nr:adenosylcobinamide-GDP ribazoletransferase [Acidimicrobiales bacterium]
MRRALAFLTPLGGSAPPSPSALAWFPAVGAALGVTLGGMWSAAAEVWPLPVAAAVVVLADLGLTGMLHLDGLVDTADGLLPPLDRERRLEVMADPRAGAFGVGAAGAVLLARWAALSALSPRVLLLGGLWCVSRSAMALTTATVPYARPSGLAAAFLGDDRRGRTRGAVAVGVAAAVSLGALGRGWGGVAAVVAALAAAAAVVALARRRLGGFTG